MTLTLPAAPNIGDVVILYAFSNPSAFAVNCNAGQSFSFPGGGTHSVNQGGLCYLSLVYRPVNSTWQIEWGGGNWTTS